MTTIEKLQQAVEKASAKYEAHKTVYRALQDATEDAALNMEDAWCALVSARWQLARALGIDPVTVCFQETP